MGGVDDHVAIVGDWMPPSPSPRSFFSSMINNDDTALRSVAGVGIGSKSGANFPRLEEQGASGIADQNDPTQASIGDHGAGNSNSVTELRTGSRGGLVDRIAARAGFNAPRLNTESIKTADLSKNSEVQSTYLTIPPGLSPTTFLDSPVFVANSMVLPSPTTGKFSFAPGVINHNSTLMTTDNANKGKENTFNSTMPSFSFKPDPFVFKPNLESKPTPHFSSANNVQACGFSPQSFPGSATVISDTSLLHQSGEPPNFQTVSKSVAENRGSNVSMERTNSMGIVENSSPIDGQHEDDGDKRSSGDLNNGGSQAEDSYNWRKYGQKQVKGSEYPRSYYKCTHQNCLVKKKVERNHEGQITEIIYKGVHNHPKPLPHRRTIPVSLNALSDGNLESDPGDVANGDTSWLAMQKGNVTGAPEWSQDTTLSAPLAVQDYCNGIAPQHEPGDGVDGSSTFSNEEDEDGHITHGSVSLSHDGEGEESESKRRRIEPYCLEMSGTARSIREPRVVVQTTSEVDILDDGYRWRKYGQKVVKGNPNPRSYYKCTSQGCNVRKHVERASHDLKSVITTYEGKHNHDVPAARNSSHINTGNSNILPQAAPNHLQRPDPPQLHRGIPQFDRSQFSLPGRPPMQPGPAPGLTFGINQHGITAAAMGLAGLGHSQGDFGRQPKPESNGMNYFMMAKAEPKAEPVADASDGYQQLMSRMPLGPHM